MCVALNKLAIVGNSGGTNIGESLRRAGVAAGHSMLFFNANEAGKGPRTLKVTPVASHGSSPVAT